MFKNLQQILHVIKMESKKYHFIITVKKSDYKIVEAEEKSIALTHAFTSPG